MKINISIYLFVVCYFLTSNWTISDYFVAPSIKNIVLGFILSTILFTRISKRNINFNYTAFIFSVIGLISVIANSLSYMSLLFQLIFFFLFSFYLFNKSEIIKVIKTINIVTYLFLCITIIQIVIIYFNQDLLIYSEPVTSSGLALNESAKTEHWIQLLGNMTEERYDFLGRTMPRFCGFLTEPSAVTNLIFITKILEIIYKKKISFLDILFFFLSILIYRSGFVTIYLFYAILILIISNFKYLYTKIIPLSTVPIIILIYFFLADFAIQFLEFSQAYEIYSLTNKDNTVSTRVVGVYEMINNISLFGNHSAQIFGVGLLVHYSILYGVLGGVFVLFFTINIFLKKYYFIFYLLTFTLLFLSKGFSAVFILMILISYVQKSSFSN